MTISLLRLLSILGISAILTGFSGSDCYSSDTPSKEQRTTLVGKAESILRDMLDQRSRLASGVFHVVGEKFNSSDPSTPEVKGPVRAFVAFDYNQRKLRLDSEQPMFVTSTPATAPERATAAVERPVVRWLRTPEFCADWSKATKDNFQYLHVRKPDSQLEGLGLLPVIDVREAGLIHYMQIEGSRGLEATIERLLQLEVIDVREEQKENIVLVLKSTSARFEIKVDTLHGMTATQIILIEPGVTFPGRDTVANVEWVEHNGIWVPSRYLITFQAGDEYRDHRYYDLSLKWESVNQSLSDSLFDYRKLDGIPDGTEIVDTRVDPQKVIGRYGPERVVEPLVKPPVFNRTMRLLLLGNFALLVFVFIAYLWKRQRQNR